MPEFKGRPASPATRPVVRSVPTPVPHGYTMEEMKMARWLHETCRKITEEGSNGKPWPEFSKIPGDRLEMYLLLGRRLLEADFAEILS